MPGLPPNFTTPRVSREILLLLHVHGGESGLTNNEIPLQLKYHPVKTSRLIHALLRCKLISAGTKSLDRRQRLVTITNKGRAIAQNTRDREVRLLDEFKRCSGWSDHQMSVFLQNLNNYCYFLPEQQRQVLITEQR